MFTTLECFTVSGKSALWNAGKKMGNICLSFRDFLVQSHAIWTVEHSSYASENN